MMEQVELVRRCQQGDRQAMGLLYSDMHDELLGICRHYVTDSATAEDLLHDSFLLIFSKIGDLRFPEKAKGWMHTVVKNVALLYVQKRKQNKTVSLDEITPPKEVEDVVSYVPTFVTYDELMKYVNALPQGYQQVFRLSVFEGLSHQQIAKLLNIEPHSSSSQLFHAKDILRKSLSVLLMTLLILAIPMAVYRFIKGEDIAQEVQQKPMATRVEKPQIANPERNATTNETTASAGFNRPIALANNMVKDKGIKKDETDIKESVDDIVIEESNNSRSLDNSTITRDTNVCIPVLPETPKYFESPKLSSSKLSMALAYSGISNTSQSSLPYGTADMNGEIDTIAHHRVPLTIGLDVRYLISPRISLMGGVRYTSLYSEFKMGNSYLHIDKDQHVNYLGFLLGANYQLWKYRSLNIYGSASIMYEIPLRSTLHTVYFRDDVVQEEENKRISVGNQWSMGAGLGVQYDITRSVGIFVEPNMQYFFQRENDIETWRTMHPFTFSLPVGIRITLP